MNDQSVQAAGAIAIMNQGSPGLECLVNLPPCESEFAVLVNIETNVPRAIRVDGVSYSLKRVRDIYVDFDKERMVRVVDRGFAVPLRLAWQEIRREARAMGIPVKDHSDTCVHFGVSAAEIVELLQAMDQHRAEAGERRADAERKRRLARRQAASTDQVAPA